MLEGEAVIEMQIRVTLLLVQSLFQMRSGFFEFRLINKNTSEQVMRSVDLAVEKERGSELVGVFTDSITTAT